MAPRLEHKKSRNGCAECRARRVKCDERKPKCSNCVKHGKVCTIRQRFIIATAQAKEHEALSAESEEKLLYSTQDLELLHWFTVTTSSSLYFGPGTTQTWAGFVVMQALKYEFLMRAVLAVSALHKAGNDDPQRPVLLAKASKSINKSLNLVKDVLDSVNDDICNALFPFSALVSIYAVGISGNHHEHEDSAIDKFIEALALIRGSSSIANKSHVHFSSGPLRPFFQVELQSNKAEVPSKLKLELEQLMGWLDEECASNIECLKVALRDIESEIELLLRTGQNLFSLRWLSRLSDEFCALVRERNVCALAILAIYAPLMQDLRSSWIYGSWNHWLGGEIVSHLVGTPWLELISRIVLEVELLIRSVQ